MKKDFFAKTHKFCFLVIHISLCKKICVIVMTALKMTKLTYQEKTELKDLLWGVLEEHFNESFAISTPKRMYYRLLKTQIYNVNMIYNSEADYKEEIVGLCDYSVGTGANPVYPRGASLGIVLKKGFRNKGIGSEFFSKTIEQIKSEGHEWITCTTLSKNIGMQKLCKKFNFTYRGEAKKYVKVGDKYEDMQYWDLNLRDF